MEKACCRLGSTWRCYLCFAKPLKWSCRFILPGEKINLGLDLRGGSHLLLRVDIDAVQQERLDIIAETIRQEFRGAKIRFSGLDVRDNSVTC